MVVYDVGESNAEPAAHTYLTNSTSVLVHLLQEFGAIGICWEHRSVESDIFLDIH